MLEVAAHAAHIADCVKGRIDVPRVQGLARTIRPGWEKFADVDGELLAKAQVAVRLGLADADRPLKVLDLGCGFGYFLAVCQWLGHDVYGVDGLNLRDVWDAMRLRDCWTESFASHKAPSNYRIAGLAFDVITMMSVNLRHADGSHWEPADARGWLWTHVQNMPPGGIIYLALNRGEQTWLVEPETWTTLGLTGTRDDNTVTLRKL